MTMNRHWILHGVLVLAAIATAGWASQGAAASLDGQNVTITLQETGFSDAIDFVAVGAGNEIVGNTGSDIGAILFSNEFVDLSGLQVVYRIQGGGDSYTGPAPECAGAPGCSHWGSDASDARFLFSGLSFGTPGTVLNNVTLLATNVFGATVTDITASSFVLNFGAAGILNGAGGVPDLGTLTMNLEVAVVPLPATLPLFLAASFALGFLRRKISCNDGTS